MKYYVIDGIRYSEEEYNMIFKSDMRKSNSKG